MLQILHASHAEFRSGWFVESLATQTLVVFLIRTRRIPFFRSRPSIPMIVTPITCAAIGAMLPFTPFADELGFAALPLSFFLILLGMIATYLVLIEIVKARFYAVQARPKRPSMTREQRHQRRVARRASRFSRHTVARPRQRVELMPRASPLRRRGQTGKLRRANEEVTCQVHRRAMRSVSERSSRRSRWSPAGCGPNPGTPDIGFSGDGAVTTPFAASSQAFAVGVRPERQGDLGRS